MINALIKMETVPLSADGAKAATLCEAKELILSSFFVLAFKMCYQFQLGSISGISVANSLLFTSPDVSEASFSPDVVFRGTHSSNLSFAVIICFHLQM